MREMLLSGYGRVYLSEIVSEFGPKTWPRRRESENALRRWRGGLDDALGRRRREGNLISSLPIT